MTSVPTIVLAALLLASKVWGNTHPSTLVAASATVRDQYETGEDRHIEATDRLSEPHSKFSPHFKNRESVSSDFLAHYVKRDVTAENSPSSQSKVNKAARNINHKLHKRSYYPYSSNSQIVEPYQSITVWKAPTFQLSRPYYIPVYGIPGRIPIYFPPQPIYVNPGQPPKNPVKNPFQGPEYLPPYPATTPSPGPNPTPSPKPNMTIDNRYDDFEGQPIWNEVPDTGSTRSPGSVNDLVPTRPPVPPNFELTHPPLDHEGSNNQRPSRPGRPQEVDRPSRPRPPPQIPTTTRRPPPQQSGPSPCVWAIISCCSTTTDVPLQCFEQRGCAGPFWDTSPCAAEYTTRAIEIALDYYNTQ